METAVCAPSFNAPGREAASRSTDRPVVAVAAQGRIASSAWAAFDLRQRPDLRRADCARSERSSQTEAAGPVPAGLRAKRATLLGSAGKQVESERGDDLVVWPMSCSIGGSTCTSVPWGGVSVESICHVMRTLYSSALQPRGSCPCRTAHAAFGGDRR